MPAFVCRSPYYSDRFVIFTCQLSDGGVDGPEDIADDACGGMEKAEAKRKRKEAKRRQKELRKAREAVSQGIAIETTPVHFQGLTLSERLCSQLWHETSRSCIGVTAHDTDDAIHRGSHTNVEQFLRANRRICQVTEEESGGRLVLERAIESVILHELAGRGWVILGGGLLIVGNLFSYENFTLASRVFESVRLSVRIQQGKKHDRMILLTEPEMLRVAFFKFWQLIPEGVFQEMSASYESEGYLDIPQWTDQLGGEEEAASRMSCKVLPLMEEGELVTLFKRFPRESGFGSEDEMRAFWRDQIGAQLPTVLEFALVRMASWGACFNTTVVPSCFLLSVTGVSSASKAINDKGKPDILARLTQHVSDICLLDGDKSLRFEQEEGQPNDLPSTACYLPKMLQTTCEWQTAAALLGTSSKKAGAQLNLVPATSLAASSPRWPPRPPPPPRAPLPTQPPPLINPGVRTRLQAAATEEQREWLDAFDDVGVSLDNGDAPMYQGPCRVNHAAQYLRNVETGHSGVLEEAVAVAQKPWPKQDGADDAAQPKPPLSPLKVVFKPRKQVTLGVPKSMLKKAGMAPARAPAKKAPPKKKPTATTATAATALHAAGGEAPAEDAPGLAAAGAGAGAGTDARGKHGGEDDAGEPQHKRSRPAAKDVDVTINEAEVRSCFDTQRLGTLTLPKLKIFLGRHNQKVSGKKEDLLARVQELLGRQRLEGF
eukprot:jgi/Mesvir1/16226/Mv08480-RA.1